VILFPDRIEVDVTEKDIAEGTRHLMSVCPIAHAVRRTLSSEPGGWDVGVSVYHDYIFVNDLRGMWTARYELSRSAMRFVKQFDSSRGVRPARFRFRRVKST